ncbi:MAG: hypothetical protein U9Q07_00590 [Planctomycetota bacterium]|nr:hypothetical protein [Planctomycetota bacterium]
MMSIEIVSNEQLRLLDELRRLLNKQMSLVRKSDLRAFETLAEQSGKIVDELGRTSVSEPIEFREQFEQLIELYQQIILMAEVEKDRLKRQLQQLGQGRKTLKAYRGRG